MLLLDTTGARIFWSVLCQYNREGKLKMMMEEIFALLLLVLFATRSSIRSATGSAIRRGLLLRLE